MIVLCHKAKSMDIPISIELINISPLITLGPAAAEVESVKGCTLLK